MPLAMAESIAPLAAVFLLVFPFLFVFFVVRYLLRHFHINNYAERLFTRGKFEASMK